MEKSTAHQRFQLIELLAYWEGRVNAKDLENYFNQSRQQSSADINSYKQLEIHDLQPLATIPIHCRTGSLEMHKK